ncbi:MAG TPA: glycosyltransferase [Candidatus Krumholzibacteria bacterium]|nr:glycosyltransferase [Candidatus Krumholzibacteria bacterium]
MSAGFRVLMVDSETTWRGGENQLLLLMRGLREAGEAEVELAAPPDAAITRRAAEIGVPCLPLPIRGGMDLVAARRLRDYFRRGRFALVHCHASHAHGVAFLALAFSRLQRRRPPFLVVSRRVDFPFARRGPSALKYRYGADLYLAISTGVRDVLVQCGVAPERIAMVPSGIDLARHRQLGETTRLRRELGLGSGAAVIGNVAALAPHKAQVDFVRAARLVADDLPEARFLLVGEGSERPRLEALVRELGLSAQVTLTGFRDDALQILSLFDCFVLSSTLEGLCTSIMDAQVLGVPVVATRAGGVPDLVQDGETGLLVPPREPSQLAAAILRLLRNPTLRSRCVAAARARSEQYGYQHMVQGTLAAYRGLLVAR